MKRLLILLTVFIFLPGCNCSGDPLGYVGPDASPPDASPTDPDAAQPDAGMPNGPDARTPPECTWEGHCACGEECVDEACVPVTCTDASDCCEGEVCIEGTCSPPECERHPGCPEEEQCTNGVCTPTDCYTLDFTHPTENVDDDPPDRDLEWWSTDDSTVNLCVPDWPLLGGAAGVYAFKDGTPAWLSHRGTRGLGVWGEELDEVDSVSHKETICVDFDAPMCVTRIEVRSLFTDDAGWLGTEEGQVDLYDGATSVGGYHMVATEPMDGTNEGAWSTSVPWTPVTEVRFFVPPGESYSAESEFAVAKVTVCACD